MKKEKIENAEKKKNDKKKKKDNLDEDGNEKPKKPLNKYQQFIRDNQERIKEEFPELSNTERFTKLAEEWGKFKATLEDPTEPVEPVNTVVEEEEKEEKEEKPKKAAKKPKKKAVE
jgi:regulator of sirC expression with transglutaminase-like and TPR domain